MKSVYNCYDIVFLSVFLRSQDMQGTATATILGGTSFSVGGFASPEAAVEAAHAMVEWCCRWSRDHGLDTQKAEKVDQAHESSNVFLGDPFLAYLR